MPSLPTLDLRRFDGDRNERAALFREAARNFGFFYLVGHGVEDRLTREVLSLSRRFLSLPSHREAQ